MFPKMIKRNYRYRGPVESFKINNFNSGFENSEEELNKKLKELNKTLNSLIEESLKLNESKTRIRILAKGIGDLNG